jgi:hypothetical protein
LAAIQKQKLAQSDTAAVVEQPAPVAETPTQAAGPTVE